MRRMQEDMDHIFSHFLGQTGLSTPAATGTGGMGISAWAPHIDVSETDQEFHIEADLPGVRQEDINIQVQDGMLVLSARMQQAQQDQQDQQDQNGQQEQGTDGQSAQTAQSNGQGQSQQSAQRQYHQRERRFGYFERAVSPATTGMWSGKPAPPAPKNARWRAQPTASAGAPDKHPDRPP